MTLWERAAPESLLYELAGSVQPRQAHSTRMAVSWRARSVCVARMYKLTCARWLQWVASLCKGMTYELMELRGQSRRSTFDAATSHSLKRKRFYELCGLFS